LRIYKQAADFGVNRFVLPPSKHEFYNKVSNILGEDRIIYSPGFGAQGCEENSFTDYPILGRSIYNSEDPKAAVLEWYKKLCKEEKE
jgi:orotidine-5'-phosphate decarboxylase